MAPVRGGSAQPTLAPAAFAAGEFNRTPVIIGNTRQETRAFVYEGNDLMKQPVTAASFEAAVREMQAANADRVLAEYPLSAAPASEPRSPQCKSRSVATPIRGNIIVRCGMR